jgi:hypothetical protein
MFIRHSIVLVVFAAVSALFSGCGDMNLVSSWCDRPIVIDGRYDDWTGHLPYLDRQSMYVGIRNDGKYLYIMLKTVDLRAQTKVLRLGLTLRFTKGEKKTGSLGIRYPLGIEEHGIPLYGMEPMKGLSPEQRKRIQTSLDSLEVLAPGSKEWTTVPLADSLGSGGIRVAVRDTSEVIVYELRVPLERTSGSPWGIGAAPGDRIDVEASTSDIRPTHRLPKSEEPRRRETTGKIRDKGRSERPPQQQRPVDNPLTEPVKFEARVTLAKNPADSR